MKYCDKCSDPKICYISRGSATCTCGGKLRFTDGVPARPTLYVPTLGDLKEPDAVYRRRTLVRFTQILGGGMFNCKQCYKSRDAKQMMRFADDDALVSSPLTDWCGVCVKKAVYEVAFSKAEGKQLWKQIREGITPSAEAIRGIAPMKTADKPRIRYHAPERPEEPAPEMTLVL